MELKEWIKPELIIEDIETTESKGVGPATDGPFCTLAS